MPYIETATVKKIREALKAEMPEFKFSVRRVGHSSVFVAFLKGPTNFEGVTDINLHWYKSNLQDKPEVLAVVERVVQIMDRVAPVHIVSHDTDYGNWPNYYRNVQVGTWEKSYEQVIPTPKSVGKITIQTDGDFTPEGQRGYELLTNPKTGGRSIQWQVGGKSYRELPRTFENMKLTLDWVLAGEEK